MSKKKVRPEITTRLVETGIEATCHTFASVGNGKDKVKYGPIEYPAPMITWDDLPEKVQNHLLRYFPTAEAALDATNFGWRNRLAAKPQQMLRARANGPGKANAKKQLNEHVVFLMGEGDLKTATQLAAAINACSDENAIKDLWSETFADLDDLPIVEPDDD